MHGNLPALEIVFKNEKDNFDYFICHGDVVNYGPWSNECVSYLSGKQQGCMLLGNHETYFINGEYPGKHPIALAFFKFCFPRFSEAHQISSYWNSLNFEDYCVQHTIENEYIYPDTLIRNISQNFIIGHSHFQFIREVGEYRLINTGSVGQNRKSINVINYILLDTISNKVELKSINYDHMIIINEMKAQNYPNLCIDYYMNKSVAIE